MTGWRTAYNRDDYAKYWKQGYRIYGNPFDPQVYPIRMYKPEIKVGDQTKSVFIQSKNRDQYDNLYEKGYRVYPTKERFSPAKLKFPVKMKHKNSKSIWNPKINTKRYDVKSNPKGNPNRISYKMSNDDKIVIKTKEPLSGSERKEVYNNCNKLYNDELIEAFSISKDIPEKNPSKAKIIWR